MRGNSGMSFQNWQYDNKAGEESAAAVQNCSADDLGYGNNINSTGRRSLDCAAEAGAEEWNRKQSDNITEKGSIRSLMEAVIMAEIISPPVSKRLKRRKLL